MAASTAHRKIERAFCTTREVAEMLNISVGTVQLWVENGMLRAWKTPGGHRRVARESVEKLLHTKMNEGSAAASLAWQEQVRPLRVLVVEDDAALLRLYDTTMSLWTMAPEVAVVDNGIDALLMIERVNPDLLILDLMVPGIDGFKMLEVLTKNPRYASMAIAVVSGMDGDTIKRHGGVPAGIEVLPKPVPFARLFELAHQLEARKRNSAGVAVQ